MQFLGGERQDIFVKLKLAGTLIAVVVLSAVLQQGLPAAERTKQKDWSVAEKLFEAKCKLCHSLDRVKHTKKSMDEWGITVARMKSYAPVMTDQEAGLITEYLFHLYGRQ